MRVETADLAIVGGGPAGLGAAVTAAGSGARVVVLDEAPAAGGRLSLQVREERGPDGTIAKKPGRLESRALADAAAAAGARIITGASVWGLFPEWELYLAPSDPADPGRIPDLVRAKAVVLATGAAQNPLAIPGWTLPGVITAGAAQALANVHRVRPGRRAVVVGADPLGLTAARDLVLAGVEVTAVLPAAPGRYVIGPSRPEEIIRNLARFSAHSPGAGARLAGRLVERTGIAGLAARLYPAGGVAIWGTRLVLNRAVTAIVGDGAVRAVMVAAMDADGRPHTDRQEEWPVDTVVTSAGLAPIVELAQMAGCQTAHVPALGGHVPLYGPDLRTTVPGVFVAGSMAGITAAPVAVAQGHLAGTAAAAFLGLLSPRAATDRLSAAATAVAQARRQNPSFLPDDAGGLRRMEEMWRRTLPDDDKTTTTGR
ncbi:MAG: FAD-dependent oxidoreductase [Armatimonadetes bacterium]|nr:FAD-dependent oxidoreductase [Armatimonadota bacterium]